mmetsp:Transcript_22789/g.36255  ORF Transcript_22789/g.36255 Transcript_22789/m.36255 type:complete len:362 (+) Transcript_22789:368-1453(+)
MRSRRVVKLFSVVRIVEDEEGVGAVVETTGRTSHHQQLDQEGHPLAMEHHQVMAHLQVMEHLQVMDHHRLVMEHLQVTVHHQDTAHHLLDMAHHQDMADLLQDMADLRQDMAPLQDMVLLQVTAVLLQVMVLLQVIQEHLPQAVMAHLQEAKAILDIRLMAHQEDMELLLAILDHPLDQRQVRLRHPRMGRLQVALLHYRQVGSSWQIQRVVNLTSAIVRLARRAGRHRLPKQLYKEHPISRAHRRSHNLRHRHRHNQFNRPQLCQLVGSSSVTQRVASLTSATDLLVRRVGLPLHHHRPHQHKDLINQAQPKVRHRMVMVHHLVHRYQLDGRKPGIHPVESLTFLTEPQERQDGSRLYRD